VSEKGRDDMTKEEKLKKITRDFCLLGEEKQEYILGMLQALVYAKDETVQNQLAGVDTNKNEGVLT
jgi:hypothetical protein